MRFVSKRPPWIILIGTTWPLFSEIGAQPVLVKDINQENLPVTRMMNVNGTLFFAGYDPEHGRELWKGDGTSGGAFLLKDIRKGSMSSSPHGFSNFNGKLVFLATDSDGVGLWKSDGTQTGTVKIKSGIRYEESSGPFSAAIGEVFYFSGREWGDGYGLWKTDGTSAGTGVVRGLGSKTPPRELTDVNGALFFAVDFSLWRSDGTEGGTKIIRTFDGSFEPDNFINLNGTLIFEVGWDLWKIDETAEGTAVLRRGNPPERAPLDVESRLARIDDAVFFAMDDGVGGRELWKTDGTTTGTRLVKDIQAGMEGSNPRWLTPIKGTLYFTATDGVSGVNIWKSDGTEGGTQQVVDLLPGAAGSAAAQLTAVDDQLYFTAEIDGIFPRELWRSDGTPEGTLLAANSLIFNTPYVGFKGGLVFPAADLDSADLRWGLWKNDGATGGTGLLADVGSGSSGSLPAQLINVDETLFFFAKASARETQLHGLWKSDGTAAGTQLVKQGVRAEGIPSAIVNKELYFVARQVEDSNGWEVWKSDGTAAGTRVLKDIWPGSQSSFPRDLVNGTGQLIFTAEEEATGRELWKSDGTTEGTQLVVDLSPGRENSVMDTLVAIDETVFFRAGSSTGAGLWRTDSSAEGTILVKDIAGSEFLATPMRIVKANGLLFFATTGAAAELWRSDGTEAGTWIVKSFGPDALPEDLVNVNGTLFFTADDGVTGRELWKSDGTSSGTRLVKDIRVGGDSSNPRELVEVDGELFFLAQGEIGKSDGSESGTIVIETLSPPVTVGLLTDLDDALFFAALDVSFNEMGLNDVGLFKSDGTPGGAVRITEPGLSLGSCFGAVCLYSPPVLANGNLFFVANDGVSGPELWTISLRPKFLSHEVKGAEFRADLKGFPIQIYEIQSSRDLLTWEHFSFVKTDAEGRAVFAHPVDSEMARFFRAE